MGLLELLFVTVRIVGIIVLVSFIMIFVLSDATLAKIPFALDFKRVAQAIVNDVTSFFFKIYNNFKEWLINWFGEQLKNIFNNATKNTQAVAGNVVEGMFRLIKPVLPQGFMGETEEVQQN
jgi:predicted PurR-regulated permease PerM